MMRKWLVVALIAGLCLLILTFPLRLALGLAGAEAAGLSARSVSGSIWSGRLIDAGWRGAELGTIDTGLAPLALLSGDVQIDFVRDDALRGALAGGLLLSGGGGVDDVTGTMSLGASLAGVPLDTVQLDGITMRFDRDGRCRDATGKLRLTLALPVPGLDLANGLSGPVACRNGRAEAALVSQSGMERLQLGIDGKGAWRGQLAIAAGGDPLLNGLLRSAGFLPTGDALILVRQGQL